MAQIGWGAIGVGAVLAGRPYAITGRPIGAAFICLGALCLAAPAVADQSIPAADNGTVACVASAKDLTRISLAGDQFASVSKISTGKKMYNMRCGSIKSHDRTDRSIWPASTSFRPRSRRRAP